MWTDGRTNMRKLIVTFRNFANAPKKCVLCVPENNDTSVRFTPTDGPYKQRTCADLSL